jgi:FtsK/SpoIIIE family
MAGSLGEESPIQRLQRLVRGVRENPVTDAAGRYAQTTKDVTKRAKARALDIGHPVVVLTRGTKAMGRDAKTWWAEAGAAKKDVRDVVAVLFVLCAVAAGFQPYGLLLLIVVWACAATWLGRDRPDPSADPETDAHISRLQSAYNGLVPYLMDGHDPDERFKPGGGYRSGFTAWEFDEADRLVGLNIQYSPFFKDGEADSRSKVERAIEGKIGQANEYLYDWDEEGNKLDVRILPPLPTGIPAQAWKVAEIEYVLGFTDPTSTARLIPVQLTDGDDPVMVELAPVVWRHGRFAAEPHLLVSGVLGSGKSNLLRSLASQALGHRQLVTAIDAEHTGHFDELTGREGVLLVESHAAAAMDLLDWVAAESSRRAERLREAGSTDDTLATEVAQPLWVFVDELPALAEAAGRAGLADPQDLLADLMRQGRTTGITVVISCRAERISEMRATVRNQAHARVGLGQLPPGASTVLFGGTLEIGGPSVLPAGRGFARVGGGPVVRLQVPATASGLVSAGVPRT